MEICVLMFWYSQVNKDVKTTSGLKKLHKGFFFCFFFKYLKGNPLLFPSGKKETLIIRVLLASVKLTPSSSHWSVTVTSVFLHWSLTSAHFCPYVQEVAAAPAVCRSASASASASELHLPPGAASPSCRSRLGHGESV